METKFNTPIKQRANLEQTPQSSNTSITQYTTNITQNKKYKIDHSHIKDLLLKYRSNQLDTPQTHKLMELVNKQISIYCAEVFSPNGMKSRFSKNYKLKSNNYSVEELANESILGEYI